MLSEQEYLILFFFEKTNAKELSRSDITLEMSLKGIGITPLDGSEVQINSIVRQFSSTYLKSKPDVDNGRPLNDKYVLTDLGEMALTEFKIKQQKATQDKETQNLVTDLQIRNGQLLSENLQLQNDHEKLEKENYKIEHINKESAAELVELQKNDLKKKYLIGLISFIGGVIAANVKDIVKLVLQLFHK